MALTNNYLIKVNGDPDLDSGLQPMTDAGSIAESIGTPTEHNSFPTEKAVKDALDAITHNSRTDLQGGISGQYYHLTQAELLYLQNLISNPPSTSHQDLEDLQGGDSTSTIPEYYHLSEAEYNSIQTLLVNGDPNEVLFINGSGEIDGSPNLTWDGSTLYTTGEFSTTKGIKVNGNGGPYDDLGTFRAGSARFQFYGNGVLARWRSQGGDMVHFNNYAPAITVHSAIAFNVTGNSYVGTLNNETFLRSPSIDTLAMWNSTNSQSFHVYNTYTDASNYEKAIFDWQGNTNILTIATEALGTGIVRPIEIIGAGTTVLGDASTDVPLTVKGATSQSANLLELKDSALKNRLTVSSDGNLITLGRTDYQTWQGIHDTCTITTGIGGGNSTTACDLVIRPSSDNKLADTYIYAGHKLSNDGGAGNLTIGQEDFSGNASPAGMGTVLIRTGSMASQAGGSFDGGTLAITTGGGGGWGSVGTHSGAGGAFNVTLGDGKATAVASVVAGSGGSFTLTAGDGGVASGSTSTGGDGGSITFIVGSKGTGTASDGIDGIIQLLGGDVHINNDLIIDDGSGTIPNFVVNSITGNIASEGSLSLVGEATIGGLNVLGYTSSSGDPTTTELPTTQDMSIHKNTTSGNVFLAYNDGGAIKKVQLT